MHVAPAPHCISLARILSRSNSFSTRNFSASNCLRCNSTVALLEQADAIASGCPERDDKTPVAVSKLRRDGGRRDEDTDAGLAVAFAACLALAIAASRARFSRLSTGLPGGRCDFCEILAAERGREADDDPAGTPA